MLQYISFYRLHCQDSNGESNFIINSDVLGQLNTFIQVSSCTNESGGILVGRKDLGTGAIIIEQLTQPGEGDKQSRTSFYRSIHHQKELERYWKKSKYIYNLAGLWHTHPEDVPSPSSIDYKDLLSVLKTSNNQNGKLLYIIIGRKKLGCWIGDKKNNQIEFIGYIDLEVKNESI